MKNSIWFVLGFTTLSLLALERPAQADTSLARDAEDSPLYAASMRNAFTDFAARDHAPPAQPLANVDSIIVVEGGKWHSLAGGGKDPRPRPLGVTTGTTCDNLPTCAAGKTCATYPTCNGGTTCNGASTCYGVPTCYVSLTCAGWYTCDNTCSSYPTCNGGPTCGGWATCVGTFSCSPGYTCLTASTCYGLPTCSGASTCVNTCVAGLCSPPLITGVNVPQSGQFQFSFLAQGQSVSYHVLYCTNLELSQWTDVFSVPANNTTVTFTHTNNAPRAYYRLSIQNL